MIQTPRPPGSLPDREPDVEWDETPCLLCGGSRASPLIEAQDPARGDDGLWFAVVQCQVCGLCYTNPRPSPACIGRFYPPAYAPHQKAQPRRSSARTDLPPPGGRLLDFGCGGGKYLQHMHRLGWQVTGLDVSSVAVDRVRNELGLPALVGTLPHQDLEPASFDRVTMRQALEHVHQPLEILREAHRLLKPGGTILVAVPNIDSLAFRLFGHAWMGLDMPRHLTHFTPPTLRSMLECADFRVISLEMVRHSSWLRGSAKLAARRHGTRRWQRWLGGKAPSRLVTWYSYLKGQSDCILATACS
jgi:SAM-dependent methyltransferase